MTEIIIPTNYKPHPKYTDYYCDPTTADVMTGKGKHLEPKIDGNGYYYVCPYTKYTLHRFVYECANGLMIPKGKEIDHIDNNKQNNKISNLQLLTHQQNMKKRDNTFVKDNHKHKHHIKACSKDGTETIYYDTLYSCHKMLNVNCGLIKMCCEGKNRVKSAKSKQNGKSYVFSYIEEIPKDTQIISMPKEKDFRKNKINCPCCNKDILSCRIEGHMKSKAHIKNLLKFDKIKNTT
jgi:hypothetical protein